MASTGLKKLWPLGLILVLIGLAWASGVMDVVGLDGLKARRAELLSFVAVYPALSVGAFIGIYAGAVALSLPVATGLTLLGGFLFGVWVGAAAIVVGATLGASILFLIARSVLGEQLRQKAGPLYGRVAKNMEENAVGYMLFMRLVPLFPFFLVNIVPALFQIRFAPYVVTTFFGIIPSTLIYANVGRELGTIEDLHDLVSPRTLVALSLLGGVALIPLAYKTIKNWKKKPQ